MAGACSGLLDLSCLSSRDVGLAGMDVVEAGETYAENALLKAEAYGHASGLLTLAEDRLASMPRRRAGRPLGALGW